MNEIHKIRIAIKKPKELFLQNLNKMSLETLNRKIGVIKLNSYLMVKIRQKLQTVQSNMVCKKFI